MRPTPIADRLTVVAWVGIIACGGFNAVAIRLGNAELTPLWGAALRFGIAALILVAATAVRRAPLPSGRARLGAVLFGLTAFAGSYAALYVGIVDSPAPTAMVVVATVPLLTLLLAVAIGQERLTTRALGGAIVALVGIGIVVAEQVDADVPVASLAALFAGAGFIAISGIIAKRIPPGHPLSANAIGMAVSAPVLAGVAILTGESPVLPEDPTTWATVLYLALVGSVGLFMLVLYVLARWSASSTSYATLVMPLVTVIGAAIVLGEGVGPLFVVGSAVALIGVFVGVVAGQDAAPRSEPVGVPPARSATAAVPAIEGDCRPPGC